MKRILLFSLLAIAAILTSCGRKNAGKTFTVGFDAEFPPYGFKDEKTGDYIGFDLDLAAEVCKRNGWTLVKKPIDWAAKDTELNAETIDCIWNGFTRSAERENKYTWTEPYVKNQQLVMVRKDGGIKGLADLKGKKVAAQDGSTGADAIKSFLELQKKAFPGFDFKELKLVADYLTDAKLLESKAVDAIALDGAIAGKIAEQGNGAFILLKEPLCDDLYAVGFKLGNTELRDTVQATLKAMVKDGTAAAIVKRWAIEHKDSDGAKINFILGAE